MIIMRFLSNPDSRVLYVGKFPKDLTQFELSSESKPPEVYLLSYYVIVKIFAMHSFCGFSICHEQLTSADTDNHCFILLRSTYTRSFRLRVIIMSHDPFSIL